MISDNRATACSKSRCNREANSVESVYFRSYGPDVRRGMTWLPKGSGFARKSGAQTLVNKSTRPVVFQGANPLTASTKRLINTITSNSGGAESKILLATNLRFFGTLRR